MFGILGFKVALCFAYLRILKASPNPRYKALIFVVMVGAILGHVAGTFILFFQCSPVRKSWRPLTPGKCLPNDATFYGLAAVSILFDVIIFVLPIPLLLKLSINIKKKIALICIFALGLLTTVCSVMRMVQILTIARTGNSTMLVLWGVIELNVGVRLPSFHYAFSNVPRKKATNFFLRSFSRASLLSARSFPFSTTAPLLAAPEETTVLASNSPTSAAGVNILPLAVVLRALLS